MTRKEEIISDLKDLRESIDIIDPEFKESVLERIQSLEAELQTIESNEVATVDEEASFNADETLAMLASFMKETPNSGVDSDQVNKLINEYFQNKKINLDDLSKDVIDEIKKNQTIILEFPNFGGVKVEVTKQEEQIPFFYDILDDVLAGNNVYLIGGAGLGKTYLAELVTKKLKREYTVINCSQYTSPIEVIGGQSIEGYKDGKLIQAWRDGKILILDEMPRLDPNTAGLFNDALAKSSKTNQNPSINSANPDMPPIPRNNDFAVIATGNIYPNEAPPPEYRANNQQDLSLLDRFSGSVYKVMPSKLLDEQFCRFQFLYDMLVGNYYEYMDAIKNKTTKPQAKGLRTVLKDLGLDELAVVSYRTLTAFRVSFEFQLVRKIAESEGNKILNEGKTLDKAFDSFMIAFNNDATQANIIKNTGLTTAFIQKEVSGCIKKVIDGKIVQTLTSVVAANASTQLEKYKQLFVADYYQVNA